MADRGYFVENDYDLGLLLQKLFQEYVTLFALYNSSNGTERTELSLKLQESIDEIAQLVLKMRQFKSDTEIAMDTDHKTISATRRNKIKPVPVLAVMKPNIPTGFGEPAISFDTFRRLVISFGDEFEDALETARKLGLSESYIQIYSTQE